MRNPRKRFEVRRQRTRTKISEVSNRLRLTVFKSNMHLHAQIIDDNNSYTLVAASTTEKDLKQQNKSNCNKQMAEKLADVLAKRAAKKGISKVVFDKGGYKFHGVIQVFADAMRKELDF
ncbi:MAG: rplR [Rickettsiaceae bacterium]|jgi:large subunit ribosomal protein L18|nr:rplR [Rickettsiaceae bacterium]